MCVCVSPGGYVRIISLSVAEASSEVPTSGGNKGRKGSRTMLTTSQLQKLNQVYEYEPRPTKETKAALSKATGLEYVNLNVSEA